MTTLPKDPFLLLSYINTQLRDQYEDLTDCCTALGIEKETLCRKMAAIDYEYDAGLNQFR